MGTGGGYATLPEILGVLGICPMSKETFMKTESAIGTVWMETLTEILQQNGEESLKMAVHEDRFLNSSYWTIVVCDGGWDKRSKGYDYAVNGCSGVIIDAFTTNYYVWG
jgi:hypothetical protein